MKINVDIKCGECGKDVEKGGFICEECRFNQYKKNERLLDENRELRRKNDELKELKEGITKALSGLFTENCKYRDAYENEKIDFRWQDCSECILDKIPWRVTEDITRDLCFAVWHGNFVYDRKGLGVLEI